MRSKLKKFKLSLSLCCLDNSELGVNIIGLIIRTVLKRSDDTENGFNF